MQPGSIYKSRQIGTTIWEGHAPLSYQTLPKLTSAALHGSIHLPGPLVDKQKSHPLVRHLLLDFALNEALLCIFICLLCHFLSMLSLLLSTLFSSSTTSLRFYCSSKHVPSEWYLKLISQGIYVK